MKNLHRYACITKQYFFLETVLTAHKDYTESKFNEDLGKFLKYAPERVGGVEGREETNYFQLYIEISL